MPGWFCGGEEREARGGGGSMSRIESRREVGERAEEKTASEASEVESIVAAVESRD